MGGEAVAPLLVGALDDPAEQVRADAAMALRMHGGSAVEQALVRALEDPSELVRQRAVVGCGSACRSVESVQALVRHALDDPAAPVGWVAVKRLEQLRAGGDPAVTGSVDAAVVASAPLRLDRPDTGQRVRAAVLLATAGDARAMPVLQASAVEHGDTRLRLQAIYALGVAGGSDAVPVLQTLVTEPAVAVYAHDALRRAAGRGVTGAAAALAGYDGPQSPVPLPPPP
jgi:HEAT repeat protein